MASFGRWRDALRRARKAVKARLPYVRRREWRMLSDRHDALIAAFTTGARAATEAQVVLLKAPEPALAGEICLFAAYAPTAALKPHVPAYLAALTHAGFAVVLVVNTDADRHALRVDPELLDRLAGCVVRENVGFDFAAWGHAYSLGQGYARCSRLLLANDSVIGPLDEAAFAEIIDRLRASDADIVGLTENRTPRRHLQSYFLAFGPRALASPEFRRAFFAMRSLPAKELVIDAYETALTWQLERAGLRAAALFPPLYDEPRSGDDTTARWRELLDAGLPFVKASLLHHPRHAEAARSVVADRLRPPS
jgi:lipopolysaccharide biosynthesis protein